MANTTFLRKVSHSSQALRENNIRGSFNGSDISREFESIKNQPENFEQLFRIHAAIGFEDNLVRLVEATNNISPSGKKPPLTPDEVSIILDAPARSRRFVSSTDFIVLKADLDERVSKFRNEILLAALIENVNIRGRIIEYLIAGEDEQLRSELVSALMRNERGIPQFKTDNQLGDYIRNFENYLTQTDVKTKIMVLHSNPKAYNIDKALKFLSSKRSVFMFYFVGIDPGTIVNTVLVSMFQETLLQSTIVLGHWSGRNSRGVTQFDGNAIKELILRPKSTINVEAAEVFLGKLIAL